MFGLFKKKSKRGINDINYQNINVKIEFNHEESEKHLVDDFITIEKHGIEKIIKTEFLNWLKGEEFKNRSDIEIYKGLKLYEINYYYGKIVAQYSPTGKDGFFGQFQFCFESCNEYTKDMLEAVAMCVLVYEGKVIRVSGINI